MANRRFRLSLTVATVCLVCGVAALAGVGLWVLRHMHERLVHAVATRTVLERGRVLTSYLAGQPAVRDAGQPDWTELSRVVESLHAVEGGLQYVSVIRDGVTVFHEQTRALDGGPAPPGVLPAGPLRLGGKVLRLGSDSVPVVTFSTSAPSAEGGGGTLEIALRREAVGREEQMPVAAIDSMFRVSLVTLAVAFGVCLMGVGWMMHREVVRERQRRQQEHLAFSGVLANGIVHDFRNPMSSLRLDVQMLRKESGRAGGCRMERLEALADRARATVDRMDKVFQEFLYLSKPDLDQPRRLDLVQSVREAVDLLAPRYEQAGVAAALDLPAGPVSVLAHPLALRRALINVLANAEQVSSRGQRVAVRLWCGRRRATVEIADRGPGVPRRQRRRIFDLFVSSRPGGTGLGLFLARAAVESAGGRVGVRNNPDGGACFRISLPLAAARECAQKKVPAT